MPRKTTILIYDGDDMERLAELHRRVEIAKRYADAEEGTSPRVGDELPTEAVQAAQAEYDSFVDEAAERAEGWELNAIGHEEFRNLLRDHPPRKVVEKDEDGTDREVTHPDDAGWDMVQMPVNSETFPKALLLFVDPEDEDHRTVQAPFESLSALRKRVRRLSKGELESMWVTAFKLNDDGIADPKALRSSPDDPRFSAT